jgi:hypothetical protein
MRCISPLPDEGEIMGAAFNFGIAPRFISPAGI